ncbi:hypothetical protein A3L04_01525 [Thermococcus chitonophagus]|uniref:Uncharacterized protein n=1 Tax=Thermococcus chitonophagus TaxID=54262 RepID=A0A2Z2N1A6_9EURY|nr:hypothetical protein A3L04_01525 [Thermococcus chitonophagus]
MENMIVFNLFLVFSCGVLMATYMNTKRIVVKPLIFSILVSGIVEILLVKLKSPFVEYGTFAIFLCTLLWAYKDFIFEKSHLINRIWSLLSILNFILFIIVLLNSI